MLGHYNAREVTHVLASAHAEDNPKWRGLIDMARRRGTPVLSRKRARPAVLILIFFFFFASRKKNALFFVLAFSNRFWRRIARVWPGHELCALCGVPPLPVPLTKAQRKRLERAERAPPPKRRRAGVPFASPASAAAEALLRAVRPTVPVPHRQPTLSSARKRDRVE